MSGLDWDEDAGDRCNARLVRTHKKDNADTPRTNAASDRYPVNTLKGLEFREFVPTCTARDLERDLNNALLALRQLRDEQNGAPLETRRQEWEAATAHADLILNQHNR